MNLEITLPIFHLLAGLAQLTAAAFAFLADRRSTNNRLIAIVLLLLGLTSFGVSLELNALTPEQALPWFALEVFSVYALSTATFVIALMLFVPKIGNKPIVRLIGIGLIFVPLIFIVIDLLDQSIPLVGFHFVINLEKFFYGYTPGYAEIQKFADGPIQVGLFWLRNISYGVLIFFPLLFVIWREREKDRFLSTQAMILLVATLVSAILNIAFIDLLPLTIPSLLSTLLFSIAFMVISIRNSAVLAAEGRTFDFFKNINMFNKLTLIVMGIIVPTVLFIGFSIYSILLNSLVSNSSVYLEGFADSQAASTSFEMDNLLHDIEHAGEDEDFQQLFFGANQTYNEMSSEEINNYLTNLQETESFASISQINVSDYPALEELIDQYPDIQSTNLIDRQGGLFAAAGQISEYDYRSLAWWPPLKDQTTVFIGTPEWNAQLNTYTIQVIIPVLGSSDEFLGAVEHTILINYILAALDQPADAELVYGLNISNREMIISRDGNTAAFSLPVGTADAKPFSRPWDIFTIDEDYVLATSRPVILNQITNQLGWTVSAYQTLESALDTLFLFRNTLTTIVIVILLISISASLFLARGISLPLQQLTEAAESLLGGNLNVEINVSGEDEIGTLGATLSELANELSGMINTLETTVEDRTKDLQRRTLQLETSSQVARQAAEIRDLQTLLNQSVTLISERFGYYHAGIFLLDNAGRYAVLQAASSPGGQRMLARGHRLQVGKVGVVGYTAGSGQPRISQDVGADVVYYDNPDMPQTRSELALPLMVRTNVIGVLDVQSTESTAFSTEDIEVLQTLADQIALAIDNVRLLQSSQRALEELQRLYGQQAGQAWRQKLTGRQKAYQFTSTGLEEGSQKAEISLKNRPGYKLRKEIKFRGQVIGNLNLMREQDDAAWSEEEQSLIDEILEQTALALENARLVDQIRLRSEQIELLQEISTLSSEILNEEKLLPMITEKLLTSLAVGHCGIVLLSNLKATLTTSLGDVAGIPEIGRSIAIEDEPISQRLIRNKEVDVFKIESGDERTIAFASTFSVPEAKTVICLPIIVREQTAGFIYLDETTPDREIDAEEFNLFNQLSTQISTAVENIRLFDETTNRAERERQVADITAKIRSSNDPKSILQTAVIELKKALKVQPQKKTDDIPSTTGD